MTLSPPLSPCDDSLLQQYQQLISQASSLEILEQVRQESVGKKGTLTTLVKSLAALSLEERKTQGMRLNEIRDAVLQGIEARKIVLQKAALEKRLTTEKIDVTLPIRPAPTGALHPIPHTINEIIDIFIPLGFSVVEGPDIEDDYHNFTALNIPVHHPARQDHDTFYLPPTEAGKTMLLRTHTSSVQVRSLKTLKPPLRILAPGRVYRCDSDATHTPMFHQVEGLVIDRHIHMGHLKACIINFCQTFFGNKNLPIRFRPSFFPFTEPSAEVDIGCQRDKGQLQIGEGNDWLEILGCGMVHPAVLKNCGIDPQEFQGFAFGMGVERLTMLKQGVPDLRTFFGNDSRWMRHYGFSIWEEIFQRNIP